MAIYELRTYQVVVGKMAAVVELYKTVGYPAVARHPAKLVGYFTGDIGALNELVHLWKFDDEADRRAFWAGLFADPAFMAFAAQLRPMLLSQSNAAAPATTEPPCPPVPRSMQPGLQLVFTAAECRVLIPFNAQP